MGISGEIKYVFIDPGGEEEMGAGSGVTRNVYSAFWQEVSNSFLIGELERVPIVRHDMYKVEWSAIRMIIIKGYFDVRYFPTVLSRCFINHCLFGSVTDEELFESFKNYVSSDERVLISCILTSSLTADLDDNEDLKDFLDIFKCRTPVNKENIYTVLCEILRQELIQRKKHLLY